MEPIHRTADADKEAIDTLVKDFFSSFDNTNGGSADVRCIYALAVPLAVFTKATGSIPESCTLDAFIEPRHALLSGIPSTARRVYWQANASPHLESNCSTSCVYRLAGG